MKKTNIGIVTPPMRQANIKPFSNLVNIVNAHQSSVCVIAVYDETTHLGDIKAEIVYKIIHKSRNNSISRVFRYVGTQLKTSWCMARLSKNVDLWVFYLGDPLILPLIIAKILRKKVVLAMGGLLEKEIELKNNNYIDKVTIPLKKINLTFSNGIIIYSENLIKDWNLGKYKNKIHIAHEHFLDFDMFKIKKKFDERDNLIGYVGRLSEEKGVLNFVEAIPRIINERDYFDILIGGDGHLYTEIKNYIDKNNLNDKVKLVGWISHDELPNYLNDIKLLVLPSYTEGLPNIMLEAMACGTLVLATPVGAIPDIIKDGETGFLMENNTPQCIAENMARALNSPDIEKITNNARALIEREFTFEASVERYRKIIESVVSK